MDFAAAYYLRGELNGTYADAMQAINVLDLDKFSDEQKATQIWQIHRTRAALIAGNIAQSLPAETEEQQEQCQAAARSHYQYVTNVADSDQLAPQLRFNIALASRALVPLSDPGDAQPLAERSVEILQQISAEFPENPVYRQELAEAEEVLKSLSGQE